MQTRIELSKYIPWNRHSSSGDARHGTSCEYGLECPNFPDLERMKKAMEDVQAASHKLAEVIYQQAGDPTAAEGAEPAAEGGESDAGGGDVVDAEFEDVDSKN